MDGQTPTAADSVPALSSSQIADAILAGQSAGQPFVVLAGSAGHGMQGASLRSLGTGQGIYITGPFDRVANAARTNAKKYMPFTADSVQLWMTAPLLMVRVDPTAPKEAGGKTPPTIDHVLLMATKDGSPAVQPKAIEKNPVQWQNGFGAVFAATGLYALFDIREVPRTDFYVVVITSEGERRYKIGADDATRSLRIAP